MLCWEPVKKMFLGGVPNAPDGNGQVGSGSLKGRGIMSVDCW